MSAVDPGAMPVGVNQAALATAAPAATSEVIVDRDTGDENDEAQYVMASGHCGLLVDDAAAAEAPLIAMVEPYECGTCGRVMERTSFVQTTDQGRQCAIALSHGKADVMKPAVPLGTEPVKADG